jgi:predicted NUDIX family NTP pyrophosphohydrolase
MAKVSAGLLMFRIRAGRTEVLLVHPGGPHWARKDLGAWSIPKGLVEEGEDPLAAARREFQEETGIAPPAGSENGPYLPLGSIRQRAGKTVHAWAFPGDCDPAAIRSNLMSLEWPPRSGKHIQVPEVDRAEWFTLDEARRRIIEAQAELLDRLPAAGLIASAESPPDRAPP